MSGYVEDENGDMVVSCPGLTGVDAKGNTAGLNSGRLTKYGGFRVHCKQSRAFKFRLVFLASQVPLCRYAAEC